MKLVNEKLTESDQMDEKFTRRKKGIGNYDHGSIWGRKDNIG